METEIDAKIRKQVEYYFSDSNYAKDKFLVETAKKHPEGYVPIDVLMTFNRLKALTTDKALVAKACKSSTDVMVCCSAHA